MHQTQSNDHCEPNWKKKCPIFWFNFKNSYDIMDVNGIGLFVLENINKY